MLSIISTFFSEKVWIAGRNMSVNLKNKILVIYLKLVHFTFRSLSFWIILLPISFLISLIKRSTFKLPDTRQQFGMPFFFSYALMCECWSNEPDLRPTFDSISRTIKRLERCHKVSPVKSSLFGTTINKSLL